MHSGDSACVLPPYLLSGDVLREIRDLTRRFALELGVVGLLNVQYAIRDGVVYVLEGEPAREPHHPVREQSDRGPAGAVGRTGDGGGGARGSERT